MKENTQFRSADEYIPKPPEEKSVVELFDELKIGYLRIIGLLESRERKVFNEMDSDIREFLAEEFVNSFVIENTIVKRWGLSFEKLYDQKIERDKSRYHTEETKRIIEDRDKDFKETLERISKH